MRLALQDAAAEILDPTTREGQITLAVGAGALLLISALQFPASRVLRRRLLGSEEQPLCAFRWIDLAGAFLAFLAGQVVAAAVTAAMYPEAKELSDLGAVFSLGMTAMAFLAPCLYIAWVARTRPGGQESLGLTGLTPGRRGLFAVLRYFAGLPMFMGLGVLATLIAALLGREQPNQEVAVLIRDNLAQSPVVILLLATVIVPLLEEIIFRGFLLELIAKALGPAAGVLLSSVLFGVLHGETAALPISGLAVILALIKLRTRSLGACWLVHGVHNAGTTMLLVGA